jgi:hypothetical protein
MNTSNVFLKPNEGKVLALALLGFIDLIKETSTDPLINWTPEARKDHREILEAAESLRIKLRKLGFKMDDLEPYKPGDEIEFLTKES